ncbi:C-C motif chemokine 14-like [Parambassis ranga]|uniref:C-C motif chemokine 14-like n=1 Tax=Parambassis ranga TaxID=210632 RepID=A0A6P7KD74_9TELE|nr:C-C motif chemokine 14-like [Parambassis ranga]
MKTLSSTLPPLLLLLLIAGSCTAMPHSVNEIAPGSCCFTFFTERIPEKQIISITKTHSRCSRKGFVFYTARGKEICVSQTLSWAKEAFLRRQVDVDK